MTHFPDPQLQKQFFPLKSGVIAMPILGQAIVANYLLSGGVFEAVVSLLVAIVIAIICCALLFHTTRYGDMVVVMFAAGGFGMLLGGIVDFGQSGMLGAMSHHPGMHTAHDWPMWSYLGMFVAGNLGMWLFDTLHRQGFGLTKQELTIYVACNLGMFIGMVLGEQIAMLLVGDIAQFWGTALMIVAMLLGMTLGMIALLAMAMHIYKVEGLR